VAGKTGTTQDNSDGWFILMHPQLVAGAWVGFDDNRITMGDWGQGARSALPIVGDVFRQALHLRWIDPQIEFPIPRPRPRPPAPSAPRHEQPLLDVFSKVLRGIFRQFQ
ncbi:MAG TPA: glycosyl transferase, partial [Ramlibacter sp.]|nr:glycosyl transferase [Ramlibacter sp.]